MEDNVADALKMAVAVLIFIVALGTSISSFTQARITADAILEYPDLGILASEDPVALDTACFDLVKEAHSLIPLGGHGAHSCGYDKFSALHPNTRGWHQIEYAESIGMGSRDYQLITV